MSASAEQGWRTHIPPRLSGKVRLTMRQALQVMGHAEPDRNECDRLRRALKAAGRLEGEGKGSTCWTTIHHLAELKLVDFDPNLDRAVSEVIAEVNARLEGLEERVDEQAERQMVLAQVVGEYVKGSRKSGGGRMPR